MEIDCFIYDGWRPRIRAASPRRDWMDDTPESFAYRCLPLGIANAHGWEIANAVGFSARWTGGSGTDAVEIRLDEGDVSSVDVPVSLFGQGTITFHIAGLFRTSPGWNLWVGGAPNEAKDGIAALSGLIETDWSPYSFTMNWRFTRPDHWVRFEPGETICFFFPVQRGVVEAVQPRVRPIEEAPELKQQFEEWSRSRDAFHERMREAPPSQPSEKWQKLYYRGVCPAGETGTPDHQSKIRVRDFEGQPGGPAPAAPKIAPAVPPAPPLDPQLARRDWMLRVQEGHRALSPRTAGLRRLHRVDPDDFLDHHYSAHRPALLTGEMADWPALDRWTPAYLAARVGGAPIDYQGARLGDARFELDKDAHRRSMPFDRFIAEISRPGAGNDSYLTAYNSAANRTALAPLHAELGRIDTLLAHGPAADEAMLWIGPAGTFTPLHHDLTNNLLAQIVGRKRVLLVPPSEAGKLRNREHVFSAIGDLTDPATLAQHPDLRDMPLYDVLLEPGSMLFIPIGWWHQVTALDFSVSATYTNFRWRNDWHAGFV
ncbi:cupin-like domain-containing protein [Sphingomonas sp. CGMCC 1.13654]|uniref:Cupin-like domain-containing protein n=1 Tax=Sphingomonas chungangi TaxID=2683589 RepID=A0A838L901_9SPHN|nr:DUF6065 family protein [Sphingomonas chungangi]MBA2935923.1 cupin-like domain-containing protein [Sphingomonas chungangi]MVW54614.1 hypothetical protein [Sphingomonas chungangi]